jgi:hypothetical protein
VRESVSGSVERERPVSRKRELFAAIGTASNRRRGNAPRYPTIPGESRKAQQRSMESCAFPGAGRTSSSLRAGASLKVVNGDILGRWGIGAGWFGRVSN